MLGATLSSEKKAILLSASKTVKTTCSDDRRKRRRKKPMNQYISSRAVRQPSHVAAEWTRFKILLLLVGSIFLAMVTIVPMFLLLPPPEGGKLKAVAENDNKMLVGISDLMVKSRDIQENWEKLLEKEEKIIFDEVFHFQNADSQEPAEEEKDRKIGSSTGGKIYNVTSSSAAILEGSRKGIVEGCSEDVSDLVYWNDPQGVRDLDFRSPFAEDELDEKSRKFFTFEPDCGGWNNVRMSLETILILAVATGRTLILPPKTPLYLLGHGAEGAREFGNFLPLFTKDPPPIPIVTMSEFVKEYGSTLLEISDPSELEHVKKLSNMCLYSADESTHCIGLYKHLRRVGWQPPLKPMKQCLIFDQAVFESKDDASDDPSVLDGIDRFCKKGRDGDREVVYYNAPKWTNPILWHWVSEESDSKGPTDFRLLNHFYTTVHFTDPLIDNYMKRWIRDYVHYNDEIVCTAGKIVHALNSRAAKTTNRITKNKGGDNTESNAGWSAWHVRRGDFQYKVTRYSIEKWYNVTSDFMHEGELLYIATDEKNKTFFEPLQEHYELFFLDDFEDLLPEGMESAYRGMIETLVASHGRTFTGTWFSTYSGYINRLRGYLGHSMKDSWYSFEPRKESMRRWIYPNGNYPAREWPIAWTRIDTDEWYEGDKENHDTENEKEEKHKISHKNSFDLKDIKNKSSKENIEETRRLARKERKRHMFDSLMGNVTISNEDVERNRQVPLEDMNISKFRSDEEFSSKPVARGVAGRPLNQTPAVKEAHRAHIERCELNVDSLAYWNDPQGLFDETFESPFAVDNDGIERFLTFGMDRGGWNNVRMSMEIIFIFALVTKRTLVLPPETKLYLMHHDTKKKTRSFADFFPLDGIEFKKRVKIISMEEFVERRAVPFPKDEHKATVIQHAAKRCDKREKSLNSCFAISDFLESSAGFLPEFSASNGCIVFDEQIYSSEEKSLFETDIQEFCGKREITYWKKEFNNPILMHVRSDMKEYRLLTHFYSMLYFTNPILDNFVKRFVRDFLHYNNDIFCAAGKIVKALQFEASLGPEGTDSERAGGYSALHIRRGDLQFEKVKLPAHIWWNNTQELFKSDEILYIATDDRNKTWFDPISQHRRVRFLDDYWDLANLSSIDPNYMGMIDTIVASRARVFVGTWFSTFSGYINRMRGYHGMSMMDSWYSFPSRKTAVHTWDNVDHYVFAYEYPTGWIGIDASTKPDKITF